MSSVEPTNPFHISRAYAVQAPAGARPVVRPLHATPGAEIEASARIDKARSLVAAVVPGRVDFSADEPVQTTGSLPMYRHPADKNAAATLVQVGRGVDVTG
jgi:hypothetical protein